jgi:hypothetical protein
MDEKAAVEVASNPRVNGVASEHLDVPINRLRAQLLIAELSPEAQRSEHRSTRCTIVTAGRH